MKEKVYVDRLFADYENTPELSDFKEEITVNLTERIRSLASKGFDEEQAFKKPPQSLEISQPLPTKPPGKNAMKPSGKCI